MKSALQKKIRSLTFISLECHYQLKIITRQQSLFLTVHRNSLLLYCIRVHFIVLLKKYGA